MPVDAYGVGSSLIRGSNDFTGDIVMTDGEPSAKVGRHYRENPRLRTRRREADPLGRRHAGRLHGAVGQALRPGREADRAGAGAADRRGPRGAASTHVASADDHELTDPEISDSPDLRNTFPPHCLRGTRGAEKILETKQRDPLPLSLVPFPPGLVPGMIEGKREILLLKKNFDVFTNPNTEPLLDALDPDEIVVFGVATDVCDDAAIRGFLQRGRRVVFVEDAAKGLDEARTAACVAVLARGRSRGQDRGGGDRLPRLRDPSLRADEDRTMVGDWFHSCGRLRDDVAAARVLRDPRPDRVAPLEDGRDDAARQAAAPRLACEVAASRGTTSPASRRSAPS